MPLGAIAAPASKALPPPVCAVVSAVVSLAHADPKATPFCSSFLHIGTQTVTTTATYTPPVSSATITNTITAPTSTATSTVIVSTTTPYTVTQSSTTTISTTTVVTTTGDFNNCNLVKLKARGTTVASASPTPSALKNLASTVVSEVCSCLAIPSPTSTATTTSTLVAQTNTVIAVATTTPVTTATVSVTTTLGQEVDTTLISTVTSVITSTSVVAAVPTGLTYYQYDDSSQSINPSDFQSPDYERTGTIQNIDSISAPQFGPYNLPGNPPFYISGLAIVFQGYFVAAATGTYTFTVEPSDDDHFWLWTGDNALGNNWQQGNQDFYHVFQDPAVSYSQNFQAGDLLPVTILWTNVGGPGSIHFDITSPDGTQVEDTTGFFAPADTCGSNPFSP
ncbi:MAG: hypothetical protein M1822_003772 [Bathelium mastoideum]|nr:MAG: hypothetical protein M1822_003772 [Bathelium mastoideum]